MNEAKYTPPPYVITRHDGDGTIIKSAGAKNVTVAWLGTNGTYGEDGCYTILPEESMANALLLSAAPELLEALEEVELYILKWPIGTSDTPQEQDDGARCVMLHKIQAAIAKAKGE